MINRDIDIIYIYIERERDNRESRNVPGVLINKRFEQQQYNAITRTRHRNEAMWIEIPVGQVEPSCLLPWLNRWPTHDM